MKYPLKNHFIVEEEEIERLDKLLAKRFPTYSRTYFQYLIDSESVLLNGNIIKKRIKPKGGQLIELTFLPAQEIDLIPEPIRLDILFEDDHLICINKPAGMVVHPAPGHSRGTFVHALLHHCQEITLPGKIYRPGIVHRLDKETSGVLIAAKSIEAHEKLIDQFKERKVKKRYFAITVGHPSPCKINLPIGRHPLRRKEMTILDEGGKNATTIITPLDKNKEFSLISAQPITGRMHQIRVHLKHNKTPILGDPIYGFSKINKKYHIKRQLLHAAQIEFFHPIKNQILTFSAPLPEDMQTFAKDFSFQET